jgi:hypothetical protein
MLFASQLRISVGLPLLQMFHFSLPTVPPVPRSPNLVDESHILVGQILTLVVCHPPK